MARSATRPASGGTSRGPERNHPATPSGECTELQRGEDVVPLEVGVVGEHLLDRHACSQELPQSFNGITQTADCRLAMANCLVGRDALQPVTIPLGPGWLTWASMVSQATDPS